MVELQCRTVSVLSILIPNPTQILPYGIPAPFDPQVTTIDTIIINLLIMLSTILKEVWM